MEGNRKLDNAQACAEVTTGDRDSVNRLVPQLVGKLPELGLLEFAQIAGRVDQIQQRGLGLNGHANTPSLSLVGAAA
jgi:hypothetical protein